MYRYLLAGTAMAALAMPLAAQTTIDTKRTQTVRTSQLKNGAGDDVDVTKNGSVELTSGSAIVVDSNHDATNAGKIVVTNSDGSSGIDGSRGRDGVNGRIGDIGGSRGGEGSSGGGGPSGRACTPTCGPCGRQSLAWFGSTARTAGIRFNCCCSRRYAPC